MDHAKKVDRCLLHALKSIGVGLAVGLVASTVIFKRKRWAFIMATGYGLGSAIAGCDFELFHKENLDPCEEAKKRKEEKELKKIAKEGKKQGDDKPKNLENKGKEPVELSKKDKTPPAKELNKKDDKAGKAEDDKKAKNK
uniref:MICOS complex subunit MIC10 n=1 Tax=Lygus hesperus TaxID=30085 RepID=A0A0A9XRM3_LYGHE